MAVTKADKAVEIQGLESTFHGARTAILTGSETPYDDVAHWKIEERLETVLPAIRAAIAA